MKKVFLFGLVFIALPLWAQEGNVAPDFELNRLGGGMVSLEQHLGNVIYINWFGHGCPTCRGEGEDTQTEIADNYQGEEFVALGIDTWNGSSAQVQDFKNFTNIRYDLLLNGSSTAQDYGASYQRSMVIDKEGIIRWYGRTNQISSINNTINALLTSTSIDDAPAGAYSFELKENYPNPFNPSTSIPFSVDKTRDVTLAVYDIQGRLVRRLVSGRFAAGQYEAAWDGRNSAGLLSASGFYVVRLLGNDLSRSMRVFLIK